MLNVEYFQVCPTTVMTSTPTTRMSLEERRRSYSRCPGINTNTLGNKVDILLNKNKTLFRYCTSQACDQLGWHGVNKIQLKWIFSIGIYCYEIIRIYTKIEKRCFVDTTTFEVNLPWGQYFSLNLRTKETQGNI